MSVVFRNLSQFLILSCGKVPADALLEVNLQTELGDFLVFKRDSSNLGQIVTNMGKIWYFGPFLAHYEEKCCYFGHFLHQFSEF